MPRQAVVSDHIRATSVLPMVINAGSAAMRWRMASFAAATARPRMVGNSAGLTLLSYGRNASIVTALATSPAA